MTRVEMDRTGHRVPAGHSRHESDRCAGWYCPSSQAAHVVDPAVAYVPAAHTTGAGVASVAHAVPAGHT